MEKKNNSNIIIIVVVIIALISLIIIKNITKKPTPAPVIDKDTVELQEAVKYDKTTEIKNSIDNIKIEDTTDSELDAIDKEIQNL